MSPLSAIGHLNFPEIKPLPLPKAAAGSIENAQPIPFYELQKLSPAGSLPALTPSEAPKYSFGATLGQLVQEVSAKSAAASTAVDGLLAGQNVPLHQTVIAMQEAGLSFQLMVEVRNKLLESYQELMRMQV